MRVIAGQAKGRRLKSMEGMAVRPSGDRLKEALFSTLSEAVPGSSVLDLYAGTGALGIEALSRGAAQAVFVERSRRAAGIVRANLELTAMTGRAEVVEAPVEDFAAFYRGAGFDIVLIDPPYDEGLPKLVVETLGSSGALKPGCVVVVEASRRKAPFDAPAGFVINQQKVYGDCVLIYLSRSEQESP